jgi:NitT/TauT family transport system permease protein
VKKIAFGAILIAAPVIIWALVAQITPRYLVARPSEVAELIITSWRSFAVDFMITLFESAGGLLLALIATFAMALTFQIVPKTETIVMPYAIALKSVPIVAMAPLLVLWFGNGMSGKIVLAALICFFPLLIGLSDGLKSLPSELRFLAAVWSTGRGRTLWLLEMPYAVPYLFSAMKVSAPLAVVGAVVAEFSGADKGLGHTTLIAAYRTDTTLLFASIVLVSFLGLACYMIVAVLERVCLSKLRVQRVLGTV